MGEGAQIVAHAGEEVLIVLVVVWIAYLLIKGMRARPGEEPASGPCLYCGTTLPRGVQRCPTCGFRARRGISEGAPTSTAVKSAQPGTPGSSP